jgi:hypothetical protein
MSALKDLSTAQLQAELRRRAAGAAERPTVTDPLLKLAVSVATERLADAEGHLLVAERQAREKVADCELHLAATRALGPEQIAVTVHINDPWDSSYHGNTVGSVQVTEHGLARAIERAEDDHQRASGNVRTDGVLSYSVTAHLPGNRSVEVPEKLWLPYSKQTKASMAKRRAADRRMAGR